MPEPQENLWNYEAVEPGQDGPPTVVSLTPEHIAAYALVAQNPDARFPGAGTNAEYGGALVAMPTMVLTYAPLLRDDIAERHGFVALEESTTARRQTPFAKCEIRWFRPVRAGDTITGTRRVLEKYERRGSRFVTFRVEEASANGFSSGSCSTMFRSAATTSFLSSSSDWANSRIYVCLLDSRELRPDKRQQNIRRPHPDSLVLLRIKHDLSKVVDSGPPVIVGPPGLPHTTPFEFSCSMRPLV